IEIGRRRGERRGRVDRDGEGARERPHVAGGVGGAGGDVVGSGAERGGDDRPGARGRDDAARGSSVDQELDGRPRFGGAGEGQRGEVCEVVGGAGAAVAGGIEAGDGRRRGRGGVDGHRQSRGGGAAVSGEVAGGGREGVRPVRERR